MAEKENCTQNIIDTLEKCIEYHNVGAENIGGGDARQNIVGNVLGILPVEVRQG